MKFKVFTKNKAVEEKEVYFRLIEEDDLIHLVACDRLGQRLAGGYILSISADGLCLYDSVDEEFGLSLNKHGQVKVTNDE